MRLEENPLLPINPDSDYAQNLNFTLARVLRATAQKVNALGDGRIAARDLTATVVPTTGTYATGDIVWKSNPVEAGGAGAKYVILGWVNVAGGTPGTFLQMRTLTGN